MKFRWTMLALVLVALVGTAWAQGLGDDKAAQEKKSVVAAAAATDEAVIAVQAPSYPLTTCVVSDEPLEDGAKSFVVDGRLVRTCCGMCAKKVKASPAEFVAKVDAGVVRAQKASYPLKKCVVGNNELSDKSIDHVHGTRLVRFCCPDCQKGFKADPAKYMAEVDKALIAAQIETYPAQKCLVSGEALGSKGMKTHDLLYGTRLVRLCCKSCLRPFQKDPAKFVAMLDKPAVERK